MKKNYKIIVTLLFVLGLSIWPICSNEINSLFLNNNYVSSYNIGEVPNYDGKSYVIINNNEPFFSNDDITTNSYEHAYLRLIDNDGEFWRHEIKLANNSKQICILPFSEFE